MVGVVGFEPTIYYGSAYGSSGCSHPPMKEVLCVFTPDVTVTKTTASREAVQLEGVAGSSFCKIRFILLKRKGQISFIWSPLFWLRLDLVTETSFNMY